MLKFLSFFALALTLLACQPKAKPVVDEETPAETSVADGTNCYLLAEGPDSTFLTLTIQGTAVTGHMDWRPWEKDGAYGDLTGTLEGNKITADWDYMIEGNNQSEEKVFIVEAGQVGMLDGELSESSGGKLILKDPAKAKVKDILVQVKCKE